MDLLSLKDWKTKMLVFYRGPPSISLDLVDEDEVYLKQLVCESEKRRIFQEKAVNFRLDFFLALT